MHSQYLGDIEGVGPFGQREEIPQKKRIVVYLPYYAKRGSSGVKLMNKNAIITEEDVTRFLLNKTEFEKKVLVTTFKIPKGKISTYKRIAEKVGRPRAYRAVATALRKNPLHPIVPCHRVVRSDGRFGGEENRAEGRKKLVEEEGIPIENGKIKISEDILF